MDNRIAIPASTSLYFPSMTVTVSEEIGRGSNSIVYRGTYPDEQHHALHHVLIKELFPYHPGGLIFRNERGEVCHGEAEEFYRFHKQGFEDGNRVHLALLERSPDGVGGNVNTFAYNGTLYTILNHNGGRSLEEELDTQSHTLEQVVKAMKGILLSLGDFHKNGYLHLDIAPDNIMLVGTDERQRIMLIDYNSTMSLRSTQTNFSIKPGYSSPEVQSGDVNRFTEATDLYSVTAVFLRWLRGYPLMPFETAQRTPPAVSDCPLLKDAPETVVSMVKQILFKGLASAPERRYGSIGEMRVDLDELDDRIRGVGITHWALWEAGKRTIRHLIKQNTALHYLRDEELFPIYTESRDGNRARLDDRMEALLDGDRHLFLSAPGGMGKTTSMLRALQKNSEKYSTLSPAVIYVPLHGISAQRSHCITDRILEHLRFKSDVQNYEQARHALRALFSKPLTRGGLTRPTAVILLDGLNEVGEGLDSILQEITELSGLEGVRLWVTSRTEYALEGFTYEHLSPLSPADEQRILTDHHLLLPDSQEMRELLRTPMMLSMFLNLSRQSGLQPSAGTAEELMEDYLNSLIAKEIASLPEDSPRALQIDVAVHLVLPRIAAKITGTGRPADDTVLLKETAACYKLIRSSLLLKAYPQWIGHKRKILGDTASCDDWYGIMVHEILWRRLGLLIKDEQGRFITSHQILCDYLTSLHKQAGRRLSRYRAIKNGLTAAVAATVACALILTTVLTAALTATLWPRPTEDPPTPYNTALSVQVLSGGVMAYQLAGLQYEAIRDLTDAYTQEGSPSDYEQALGQYENRIQFVSLNQGVSNGGNESSVAALTESGDVFPWSEHTLEKEEYQQLLSLVKERLPQYEDMVGALVYVRTTAGVYDRYGEEYLRLLDDLVELDADITAVLYAISCRGATDAMIDAFYLSEDASQNLDAQSLSSALTSNTRQNRHLPDTEDMTVLRNELKILLGERAEVYSELQRQGAFILYLDQKGES